MTAKDLFSKDATVEYRVVPTLDGNAQWHWVLFNVMGKVLAGNTAPSRGKASGQARAKARQLHRKIRGISVTGLVSEGRPIDIKQFIASVSNWIEVAHRFGYKPTQDQFWSKAAKNEPIYARKIEGNDYDYTISVFGGIGNAQSGGQLVWVAIDFQDVANRNRIALQTFLTTDKKLMDVLMAAQSVIEAYGESWGEVDRVLGEMRRKGPGVFEAEETGQHAPLPTNPARDYIMGVPTWQEHLKLLHASGPHAQQPAHDPEMKRVATYGWHWGYKEVYMALDLYVDFVLGQPGQVPRRVSLRGDYMDNTRGTLWHNNEPLDVEGDTGMNAFLDKLDPVIKQCDDWHAAGVQPDHWAFANQVAWLHTWMINQPQMAAYI